MVDGVLAPRAQSASGVGGVDRARTRGPVGSVQSAQAAGQRAFGANFAESSAILQPASNDQVASGSGLLSTNVQMHLAETRTQEATAPFVAPSRLGQAINIYAETQDQVRKTIRANASGGIAAGSALVSRISDNGGAAGQQSAAQAAPQAFNQAAANQLASQAAALQSASSADPAGLTAGSGSGDTVFGSPVNSSIDV